MKTSIKERFNYCLSETKDYERKAFFVLSEFKIQELQDVLEFLIKRYENEPNLLKQFYKEKGCYNIEMTVDQLDEVERFTSFVFETQS